MNKLYYRLSFDILKRTIVLLSILYLSLTNLTYGQSWTQLTTTGGPPAIRDAQTAFYDPTNNLVTIFGGYNGSYMNDVWVLVNANGLGGANFWTQLEPTGTLPIARRLHTAVYDTTNNRMTIFAGAIDSSPYYMNDVWVLSNANGLGGTPAWTQLFPTGSLPTTREGHTAVYDTKNNRMIIFGGDYGSGVLKDVWVLSNANGLDSTTSAWIQFFPTGSNSTIARFLHSAVYDAANNRMIIFGGDNGTSPSLNDVWVLSNANGLDSTTSAWTQLFPTGSAPTTRVEQTAVYDAINNRMIIFGGNPDSGDLILSDVWVLSNANGLGGAPAWTQLNPTGNSSTLARYGHTAVYDPVNNRTIIFGGRNNLGYLNDVWVLSNTDKLSAPNAGFYGNPTSGTAPFTVNFIDTSLNNPTSWNWNFGDGNTDTIQNPTHTYGTVTIPTAYTVQLIASNLYGISTSIEVNYIYVYETELVASFVGTPLFGYSPLTVYFSDSSYIYGNNLSWNWIFGDGSTSNIQNPIHIYTTTSSATAYTVQLIVTTSYGSSTATKNNYVIVLPPVAIEDWMLYSNEMDSPQAYLRRE